MKAKPFLRAGLAFRLSVVYGLLTAGVVIALGLGIHFLIAHYLKSQAAEDLAALTDFYAAYSATAARDEAQLAALAPQIVDFFAPQAGYEVRLFSARTGALLAATHDSNPLPSTAALRELGRLRPTLYLSLSRDRPDRQYAARAVVGADGSELAVVELSRDVTERVSWLRALRRVLLAAGGSAVALFLVASLVLSRQMTRPLRQMESATRAIATGDFERRIKVASGDEIGRLAASINQMASDLARLEASRREFIARISHDLRTPLTSIKGFVANLQEIAPDTMKASLATLDQQTERLIRLVNELLTLARLQRGELRLKRVPTDLAEVAQSAMALVQEKARRLGIELTLVSAGNSPTPADGSLRGDPDRLQQLILNLLDNALRATQPGGCICVQITDLEDEVVLRVSDTGQGLTPEEAGRAFEPYYRGEGGGAGLGLSIAREIVNAHGGRIWLEPKPEGGAEAGFAVPRRIR
jgi:signal transduction histidine kinase